MVCEAAAKILKLTEKTHRKIETQRKGERDLSVEQTKAAAYFFVVFFALSDYDAEVAALSVSFAISIFLRDAFSRFVAVAVQVDSVCSGKRERERE
jgi:uncharacterized membrane protein